MSDGDVRSDALVFFGATGDLACKWILPALQAMVKRGHLDVPVIGVPKAGWNPEQLQARAKDSLDKHGSLDPEAFGTLWMRTSGSETACTGTPRCSRGYVEEAWRIVDPVLKGATPFYEYEPGTWRLKEVDSSVSPPGGWHNPTVRSP
jgi:glucose-6-phosphate 1-dehydrogenase